MEFDLGALKGRGASTFSLTTQIVGRLKVPSCGQPTSKAGHSAEQKVTNLLFFTSNDRFCALDLKSEKWLVIRDKGVEVVCPMITEKYTGSQKSTQRAKMEPALTQSQQRQTDNKCKVATNNTTLGLLEFPLNLTCRMFTEQAAPPARCWALALCWT